MYLLIRDTEKVRTWISVPQKQWKEILDIVSYLQEIRGHLQFDAAVCTCKADFKVFLFDPY